MSKCKKTSISLTQKQQISKTAVIRITCVLVTPCACCGCWAIPSLSIVVGTRVLWMSNQDPPICPDAQDGIRSERQPLLVCCLCLGCEVACGAFAAVLERCSGEVDIMCIHQQPSSSACGSPSADRLDAYTSTLNTVSFRRVRFDMAGVTDVKHSCASRRLRLSRRR